MGVLFKGKGVGLGGVCMEEGKGKGQNLKDLSLNLFLCSMEEGKE